MPRRVGANPPAALYQLRREVETSIYAACRIPYALATDVKFRSTELRGIDLQGRARAYKLLWTCDAFTDTWEIA